MSSERFAALRARLEGERMPLFVALVGVVLALPTLFAGWVGDDYAHIAIMEGLGAFEGREPLWDLFRFFPGDERNRELEEVGMMPWWALPELRAAFLRPVSSLTHLVDHRLWPRSAVKAAVF